MPEFMTVSEVAIQLKVSEKTVRRLCKSGEIPHTYIGSQIRIDIEDFKNYLIKSKKGD